VIELTVLVSMISKIRERLFVVESYLASLIAAR
jgi:hypothetical protein